jgi:tetratricopeptide (TPR) repeat protein
MIFTSTYRNTFLNFTKVLLVLFVFMSCGNAKKNKGKSKEEQPVATSSYGSDIIYKNNFYEAIRLKTVGDLEGSQKILEWCIIERPNDDAVLFLLATYAEGNMRFTRARDYISRASAIDPNNIWYTELLGKIQLNMDDLKGAEESYAKMVAFDPYNREWLYYYSEILTFNGKLDKALDVLGLLIAEVGPIPELVNQRNELYLELNREDEMLIELKKLVVDYPDSPEFASMLVYHYLRTNKIEQAEKTILSMIDIQPDNASLRIGLADIYKSRGDKKAAYAQLKIAFELKTLDPEQSVSVVLSILESERTIEPDVLDLALLLQKNYPDNYMAHAMVGDIYKRQKKYDEALKAFERSLALDEDNFHLWFEVISITHNLKDYSKSLVLSEKSLELFPSQPQFYYYAGMSCLQLMKYGEASAYLDGGKDYIVRDPLLKAQFELALAEVQLAQNKIPQARKYLESAENLAPNDKLMMNNRAYVMAKYRLDLEKALDLINRALVGNEKDGIFLDTKAWVHFARKEYELALEFIAKAYALAPENPDVCEHYGDILFKLNRADEALVYWMKARDLGNKAESLIRKIQTKKLND